MSDDGSTRLHKETEALLERLARPDRARPRWIAREEFVRRFFGHQADAALRDELGELTKDAIEDLTAT